MLMKLWEIKRKLLITDLETLINLNECVFSNFASLDCLNRVLALLVFKKDEFQINIIFNYQFKQINSYRLNIDRCP